MENGYVCSLSNRLFSVPSHGVSGKGNLIGDIIDSRCQRKWGAALSCRGNGWPPYAMPVTPRAIRLKGYSRCAHSHRRFSRRSRHPRKDVRTRKVSKATRNKRDGKRWINAPIEDCGNIPALTSAASLSLDSWIRFAVILRFSLVESLIDTPSD